MRLPSAVLVPLLLAAPLAAQPTVRKNVATIYAEICANCHGRNLAGGSAPSLLDDVWTTGRGTDADLSRVISDGALEKGMPAFHSLMSEADVRAMVIFIREQRANYQRRRPTQELPGGVLVTDEHRFRVETLASGLDTPWAIAFLPDGRALVTEKAGRLRIIADGQLDPKPVAGTPAVRNAGQGGLMEVAVHPRYAENGWIYLAYSDPAKDASGRDVSLTKIVRGKLRDGAWVEQQTIWQAPLEFYRPGGGVHFGCRIAFDAAGYLYFSHGERGRQNEAQELARPNGKIHRLHDDGRVPADNPFFHTAGAFGSIWTYGNRNPQGLDFDPRTGLLWETEHGPRGGDELNVIRPGRNYGWPVITYGMNYDGSPITGKTAQEGMEQPVLHWTPSIAVCGIDFYEGTLFPRWTGNLLVTALAQQELRRVVIDGERVVEQEVLLKDLGRLRDVASAPDGSIWVAVNDPGLIVRLVPAN